MEKEIGYLIESKRRDLGINQMELAKEIGMSVASYSNLIKSSNFRIPHLQKIANVFQVPITYFFDGRTGAIENKQKSDINLKEIKRLEGLLFLKDDKTKEIIHIFTNIIELAEFDNKYFPVIKPYLYIFLHIVDIYYKGTLALELKDEIEIIKKKFNI